jgi:N-acetylmuramoyl-L-alanine amidase
MKRALLFGFLAAASLVLPAGAASRAAVPVQVEGQALASPCYLSDSVTYVPLRELLDALGGWAVRWDDARGAAAAEHESGAVLTADPAADALQADGAAVSGSVWVEDGRTYVPLRKTAALCGAAAAWDAELGGARVQAQAGYTEEDLYWLSRIISAESRGETYRGQVAVGNVVLNRVKSEAFPATVREVVFDRKNGVQFEPVANGSVYQEPTASAVQAARAALAGERPVGESLYFYAPALSQGAWIKANRPYHATIGCHRFYL